MRNTVFISWKDPQVNFWYVIGRLSEGEDGYSFSYTKGVKKASRFVPFFGMPDLNKKYNSPNLFPVFANRLMKPSRSNFREYIEWLDLPADQADPLTILSRSEGRRTTDSFQIFRKPELNEEGSFSTVFFVHGLSHCDEDADRLVSNLKENDSLEIKYEENNPRDDTALLVSVDNPKKKIGYVPRYLSKNIVKLVKENTKLVTVKVVREREDVPYHYRLLCSISGHVPWHLKSSFFSDEEYEDYSALKI